MPPKSSKRKTAPSSPEATRSSPPRTAKKARTKLPAAAPAAGPLAPAPAPPPPALPPSREQLQARVDELESQVSLLQQQIKADDEAHEAEKKKLTREVEREVERRWEEKWDAKQAEIEVKWDETQNKLEEDLQREHGEEISLLRSACKELVTNLEKKAKALEAKLKSLRQDLAIAKAVPLIWETRANDYLTELTKKNEEVADLTEDLDEANTAGDVMNRELGSTEGQVKGTKREIGALEEEILELEKMVIELKGVKEVGERYFEEGQRYYLRCRELEAALKVGREGGGEVVREDPVQRPEGTWH